jgi:hypothetical protein
MGNDPELDQDTSLDGHMTGSTRGLPAGQVIRLSSVRDKAIEVYGLEAAGASATGTREDSAR